MIAAFILAVIFAFVIVMVWMNNRKTERMLLMQQGKDPNIANQNSSNNPTINHLKWGIIIISIGIGALLGNLLDNGNEMIYFSLLLVFSGLGLILSYLVTNRYVKDIDIPKNDDTKITDN